MKGNGKSYCPGDMLDPVNWVIRGGAIESTGNGEEPNVRGYIRMPLPARARGSEMQPAVAAGF
jgi:hypothetical protein